MFVLISRMMACNRAQFSTNSSLLKVYSHLVVKVITCGFPPLEDRDKTLKTHSGYDFFGGGTLTKEETVIFDSLFVLPD